MNNIFAGFDLGGTKISISIGTSQSENGVQILDKKVFASDPMASPEAILEQGIAFVKEMAPAGVCAAGISCGGPLDPERKHICRPPNLPLWDHVPVVEILQNALQVPVGMQNDADACALAEWKCGAGRGCSNMIFLTFGTGLGAGLILNGALYTGANGMAGEAGHIRIAERGPAGYGKFGSFEGFCSGAGLAQLGQLHAAKARQNGLFPTYPPVAPTARDIAQAAMNGDPTARAVYEECGAALGKGLSVLIDLLNPERIVLGSIFVRSQSLLLESMKKTLAAETLEHSLSACTIVPAQLGEALGDTAALCVAREALRCR